MKKGLIFATTLAMALGVGVAVGAHQGKVAEVKADAPVVYLKPGVWAADNAKFVVHNWADGIAADDILMEEVATDQGVYKCTISATKNKVIFKRMNPSASIDSWEQGELWNQTRDLTYPSATPCYKINGWGENDAEWETYSEPAVASVYKYSLNGATAVTMEKGSGSEYTTGDDPIAFKKGDVVSFLKDDAAYAVTPKEDSAFTTVKSVTGGLEFVQDYTGVLYLDVAANALWAGNFAAGYYLMGVGGSWDLKEAPKASLEETESPEAYVVKNVTLAKDAEIKMVNYVSGKTIADYFDADANKVHTSTFVRYSVTEEHHNLKVKNAGTYDIYYNPVTEYYSIEDVNEIVPANGYYLVGTESNFKYKGATTMSVEGIAPENSAELMNYSAKKDEKIKVRQYSNGEDNWGFYGGSAEAFGAGDEEGNFVFSEAQNVDIFAKWVKISEEPEKWEIKFFVTAHAERYDISVYDVLFEGKRLASTSETPHVARATAGINFEYELPDMNGYYARGLYTDAACTVEYTATKYTADGTLYAKYTRLGEYMTGDATYSGSADLAWNVDGATYLSSVVNDPNNRLEGSVTIPASASKENPIKVKPLKYVGDAVYYEEEVEKHTQWEGVTYTLGATYSFVSLDGDSNLSFTKGGTFAVYINKSDEIFLNEGADAFYTKFLTDTGAVCKTDNKTDLARLGEVWTELEGVYNSLSKDEKDVIVAVGFNGGDEKGDDLHKVIARYAYIVTKYGSATFKNFIFGVNVNANPSYDGQMLFNNTDNTMMFVIIAIAATGALAFGTFFYLKKRKQK